VFNLHSISRINRKFPGGIITPNPPITTRNQGQRDLQYSFDITIVEKEAKEAFIPLIGRMINQIRDIHIIPIQRFRARDSEIWSRINPQVFPNADLGTIMNLKPSSQI
jgi:hypothetical protein